MRASFPLLWPAGSSSAAATACAARDTCAGAGASLLPSVRRFTQQILRLWGLLLVHWLLSPMTCTSTLCCSSCYCSCLPLSLTLSLPLTHQGTGEGGEERVTARGDAEAGMITFMAVTKAHILVTLGAGGLVAQKQLFFATGRRATVDDLTLSTLLRVT